MSTTESFSDCVRPVCLSGDKKYESPILDANTNATVLIDYPHHEIHNGDHYFVSLNKDVPNGGTYNLAFTTPNTTSWAHMIFSVTVELESEICLYEGVTSFTGGTAVTPRNNDRNSIKTSGITDMVFDTTVTLGTPIMLMCDVHGSGKAAGGEARGESEIILKQNTKYYLLITNQATGAANESNINLEFYMHTNQS